LSNNGTLYALGSDGNLKWKVDIGASGFSPVLDENGTIYIGTMIRGLIAIGHGHDRGGLFAALAFLAMVGISVVIVVIVWLRRRNKYL
jgi:hypothetical protein